MLGQQSQLDMLMEFIEHEAEKSNLSETFINEGEKPQYAQIMIKTDSMAQKPPTYEGMATYLGNRELRFRCPGDQARSQQVEARITISRNIEGDSLLIAHGAVVRTDKISGGYQFTVNVQSIRQHIKPAHRIFAECVATNNVKVWNQWYAPMNHSVDLQGLILRGMDLSLFDLCCANLSNCDLSNCNLSGTNLSGANLDNCKLEGAIVEGADFFAAAIPAKYESLITASGLLEKESIILL